MSRRVGWGNLVFFGGGGPQGCALRGMQRRVQAWPQQREGRHRRVGSLLGGISWRVQTVGGANRRGWQGGPVCQRAGGAGWAALPPLPAHAWVAPGPQPMHAPPPHPHFPLGVDGGTHVKQLIHTGRRTGLGSTCHRKEHAPGPFNNGFSHRTALWATNHRCSARENNAPCHNTTRGVVSATFARAGGGGGWNGQNLEWRNSVR